MNVLTIIGLAIALAMDAFAVSISGGVVLKKITRRHYFRFSFHFGLFQFLMPIIGWYLGRTVYELIASYDHWVTFGLLAFIGGRMIVEAIRHAPDAIRSDPTRGASLVALSIATSIDALAVGLSLAFLKTTIWMPSLIIGCVAAAASLLGLRLGQTLGYAFGRRAEIVGGSILIAIGIKILVEHLLS
jgi:putative Mn2+ efflux pump MntP